MKMQVSRQFVGVLALLCSSAGMAATVTILPSNATPGIGDTFTVTIQGAAFPQTAGATLGLSFDSAVVSFVSATLPATGPFSTSSGSFLLLHPSSGTPTTFDILAPSSGTPPSGAFDAAIFTFSAVGAGLANIVFIDNASGAGTLAWFDANTFDPIPATYTQATVTVASAAGPLIGVADSVSPTSDHDIPFGNVAVLTSSTQTVTINNAGSADLHVGTLAAVDTLAAPFSLANNLCSGQTLTPGTSCTVDVIYSPTALVTSNDSFNIPSDDPANLSVTVTLSGTGEPAPTPNIGVTDSVAPPDDLTVSFGSITEGGTSTQTVTVTNSGNANLVLGIVAAANPLAAPFSIGAGTDNCSGQTLPALGACNFQVVFQPVAPGPFNDTLDIPSNDPDTPTVTVTVDGTGTPPEPNIVVTDSAGSASDQIVTFGSIAQGQTGTQTVTVTNNGDADLVLGTVATVNPLAAPFSVGTDNCSGQTLTTTGPGSTCTFLLLFQPTAAGPFNDALDIPSNDSDQPSVSVSVSGIGAASAVPNIAVTDSINPTTDREVAFGSIEEHTTSTQTVTLTNSGDASLTIGDIGVAFPLDAPFSIDEDLCSGLVLAPTESCTITLGFAPPAIQIYNDTFDIPSDDPDEASIMVAVSGSAQPGTRSHKPPSSSAFDPVTLLGLGVLGFAVKRRRGRSA